MVSSSQQHSPHHVPGKSDNRDLHCGIFYTVEAAEQTLRELEAAGIPRKAITLVVSEETRERHFPHREEADEHGETDLATSATGGGLLGMLAGGLGAAGMATATGMALVTVGPSLLVGGAVVGAFLGAMRTRGHEGELADFYDQALTRGGILVGVDTTQVPSAALSQRADEILQIRGARFVPLERDWPGFSARDEEDKTPRKPR